MEKFICEWCNTEVPVIATHYILSETTCICDTCICEYTDDLQQKCDEKDTKIDEMETEILKLKTKVNIMEGELDRLYRDNMELSADRDVLKERAKY